MIVNRLVFSLQIVVSLELGVKQDLSVLDDVIPSMVMIVENYFLIGIPFTEDIHDTVFAINANSTLGLDDVYRKFYQYFSDIVGGDVVLTVQDFFRSKVIFLSFNSSFIVLLPKLKHSILIDQYCPMLQTFRFSSVFRDCIDGILSSSRLLVLNNRNLEASSLYLTSGFWRLLIGFLVLWKEQYELSKVNREPEAEVLAYLFQIGSLSRAPRGQLYAKAKNKLNFISLGASRKDPA
ncbi:hypothetical protein Ddye_004870 [Dipteronia dyeriana]|uniref:Maturase K n=1 Tax=Dipteronia dyeriana TaxID=168575 RepID=A0AAD9XFL3_9ROSI|nr:hypothetical protein Ddye_004870 [Dipteronia dyeriana]